jgi:hypothetical protein
MRSLLEGIVKLRRPLADLANEPNTPTGYRFPPDVISHAVWLYHRFCLSFRDVEEMLKQGGYCPNGPVSA